nr:MAG TPA: hypothetical protein [Caudoviricetes sp.]
MHSLTLLRLILTRAPPSAIARSVYDRDHMVCT